MNLKKIRKLTVEAHDRIRRNLSAPGIPLNHPLWKTSELLAQSIEIIDICLSGENLK